MDDMRFYMEQEINIKEAMFINVKTMIERDNKATKMMKAILRIPRLCDLFHKFYINEGMKQYPALEKVYQTHFRQVASLLT